MTEFNPNSTNTALLAETSRIAWKDLQYFFAGGKTLYVSNEIDLIQVAENIANDNIVAVEKWMQDSKLGPVSNDQAKEWCEEDATVWAVVVKPWVLVQGIPTEAVDK